ncbi:hypothetical protein MXL26_11025 [Acinetobacter towneri]|uniref:hypothetical protein n=1 Tax=Acinetobacter towneri TaxID=202956 RepID=UPI002DB82334|nr:hypothetical protein [Acinetobacter towneri]MEB6565870.1 hypothetical protein [Acinetobacter towneri]
MSEMEYKISMLGPTRVGKTSLVASILGSTREEVLAGTALNLKSLDLATEKKLSAHAKELRSSLNAGSFNSGAVAGTQEPAKFRFSLNDGANESLLNFTVLDFPGGWIDPDNRPEQRQNDWEECKKFIHSSSVVIIPVESPVLMEAIAPKQQGAIEYNIHSEEIKEIITDWAKFRTHEHANEPSTIIFAPVKCESYFTDNGFTSNKDKSDDLKRLVEKYYADVIQSAENEFEHNQNSALNIIYTAVDTIGCVEIINGQWDHDKESNFLRFSADYAIRKNPRINRKGGEDIFIALFKNLLKAQEIREKTQLDSISSNLSDVDKEALRAKNEENLWDDFWGFWGVETERAKKTTRLYGEVGELNEKMEKQLEQINKLKEIIEDIGNQSFSSRTSVLA